MNFFEYKANKVIITDELITIFLKDGRKSSAVLSQFPNLKKANPKQRQNFEIINGYAIYWPELDEDLSVAGFFEV